MDKQHIIDFFDRLAADWDANLLRDDTKIGFILDCAGVTQGTSVLDVACGTGVLIPDYLARNVKRVVAVDISSAMIAAAQAKCSDPRVRFLHADIETVTLKETFTCCVVYNAFPHFPDAQGLLRTLAERLSSNGRLTIAHSASRERVNARHAGGASRVSIGLMHETALAALMQAHFEVDIVLSNEELYLVSGRKKGCAP